MVVYRMWPLGSLLGPVFWLLVSPFYWVITIAQMQKVQALRDIKTDLEELSTHQNHDNDRLDLCICRIIECVFVDRGRHSKFWSINNQQVFPGQQYTSISIVRLKKFPMESAVTSALQYRVTLLIVTASWDNSPEAVCRYTTLHWFLTLQVTVCLKLTGNLCIYALADPTGTNTPII